MMLSRTASQLFWMSRYMERAENLARLLDVTHSLSLLPQSRGGADIAAALATTGALDACRARHPALAPGDVLHFMTFDAANPASIISCLKYARENAHAVRGKITGEMWESINASWLEARQMASEGRPLAGFFDWVKERSHLFRGTTYGTIQRNDAFSFIRLGTFLERADNTARLIDVKSHLVGHELDDSAADFYLWGALLRSLGAFEAYHELYRDSLSARRVAELLILRPDVPRSLRACVDEIAELLPRIQGDTGHRAKRLAATLHAELSYDQIDSILAGGLHAYLTQFLSQIHALGAAVHGAYLEAA
ncbi:alpha-E domain-containing protein [Vogesella facilis]|uniref:Alpha-E domain-containing protein n=1 Tax=Vogesella facilis TaxID=1655232 RepID=A0ABV7RG29_9NEIS